MDRFSCNVKKFQKYRIRRQDSSGLDEADGVRRKKNPQQGGYRLSRGVLKVRLLSKAPGRDTSAFSWDVAIYVVRSSSWVVVWRISRGTEDEGESEEVGCQQQHPLTIVK